MHFLLGNKISKFLFFSTFLRYLMFINEDNYLDRVATKKPRPINRAFATGLYVLITRSVISRQIHCFYQTSVYFKPVAYL